LVAGAVAAGNVAVDAAALAEQVVLYRSATRLGLAETAARTGQIMKKHHALARRLIDRQADYHSPPTPPSHQTTTAENATSA
jgi:hypothetical protein